MIERPQRAEAERIYTVPGGMLHQDVAIFANAIESGGMARMIL